MGVFLGISSAMLFGVGAVCIRLGMRVRPIDNGHFMTVFMNCVIIGSVTLVAVRLPSWNWAGVALLFAAGAMTTFMARGTGYAAIRRIGPSRQSAILLSAPVFAALTGWLGLGEAIQPREALGAAIVIAGLLCVTRSRPGGFIAGRGEGVAERSTFVSGALLATASAALFGAGFVVRKLALARYDSAVAGALIGAVAALTLIVGASGANGSVERLVHDNLRRPPFWFVVGGLASSLALMAQFAALSYLPAWIVSLLQATQVCWTVLLSYVLLRDEEKIGVLLLLSLGLVLAGVCVMTLKP